jgi:hypothetical protein
LTIEKFPRHNDGNQREIAMINISRTFSGPPGTGNGGYVCGSLADHIEGPAEVMLKAPCPLDTALDVVDHGDHLSLMDGDKEIAIGRAANPSMVARAPISFDQAVMASREFTGFHDHPFPGCFVCGTDLAEGDGLRIYAGAVAGEQDLVAAPWLPHANHGDENGVVDDRIIWSALDCPGAFTVMGKTQGPMLLGKLNTRIFARPVVGEACVVLGWKIAEEGRKIMTGTALYGETGDRLAIARATWIIVKQA